MPRHTQFGMRRRTASPRRLVLRLVMLDLSQGFFKKLAESFDDLPSEEQWSRKVQTFELPLTEEKQETTGAATLDATAICSLRSMFLLLDDWNRKLHTEKTNENSSKQCEILVDTKIH